MDGPRRRRRAAHPARGRRRRPPQDAKRPARYPPGGLMSAPTTSRPPGGYFSIGSRLMRGYGPLAVLALMLLLVSVLVPSKVPDATNVSASGNGSAASSGGSAAEEGPEIVRSEEHTSELQSLMRSSYAVF